MLAKRRCSTTGPAWCQTLLPSGGVDGVHDWCGTIYTEVDDTVRDRWRRPRMVAAQGIRREGPKFLTGSDIQRMQLAVSAAGIGRIQLAFKYACRGKAAAADVGPPLHGQSSPRLRGRGLSRWDSRRGARGRSESVSNPPLANGRGRHHRRAKQRIYPGTTADHDRPGQILSFPMELPKLFSAALLTALRMKLTIFMVEFLICPHCCTRARLRTGTRNKNSLFQSGKAFFSVSSSIVAHPFLALRYPRAVLRTRTPHCCTVRNSRICYAKSDAASVEG